MSIRASILSFLVRNGFEKVVLLYWKLKRAPVSHLVDDHLQGRFENIYRENLWSRDNGDESRSGPGSSLAGTETIRKELPGLLAQLKVDTLVDIGCGDFHWMKTMSLPVKYIGLDVAPSIVTANTAAFERDNVRFEVSDATVDPLPDGDAALCREVLFHLSFKDGNKLLQNLLGSNIRYFICTTDPTLRKNVDIPSGEWRDINLQIAPYSLPDPIFSISDGQPGNPHRLLSVWDLNSIRAKLTDRVLGADIAGGKRRAS